MIGSRRAATRPLGALAAAMMAMTVAGCVVAAAPACADPPAGKGGGHGGGKGHGNAQGSQGQGNQAHGNPHGGGPQGFVVADRSVIQGYYAVPAAGGCPPGLAKKHNGCMPPGKARQYVIGRPLPAGVLMYPLPSDLLVRLAPPPGYQYMRVGSDILMLAIGTNMVVSALTNLVR